MAWNRELKPRSTVLRITTSVHGVHTLFQLPHSSPLASSFNISWCAQMWRKQKNRSVTSNVPLVFHTVEFHKTKSRTNRESSSFYMYLLAVTFLTRSWNLNIEILLSCFTQERVTRSSWGWNEGCFKSGPQKCRQVQTRKTQGKPYTRVLLSQKSIHWNAI